MFERFLGKKEDKEEKFLDKQLAVQKESNRITSDVHTDQLYMDIQDRKSDLIRWQQNLDEDLFRMVLKLLCLTTDQEGNVKPLTDRQGNPLPPMCNTMFIEHVFEPSMIPFMSKNLINSNYAEERILKKMKHTANNIVDKISDDYEKFGINPIYDGEIILRMMKNYIEDSCWRSLKGWTKKTDSSVIKRHEVENTSDMERQKSGLFSKPMMA